MNQGDESLESKENDENERHAVDKCAIYGSDMKIFDSAAPLAFSTDPRPTLMQPPMKDYIQCFRIVHTLALGA